MQTVGWIPGEYALMEPPRSPGDPHHLGDRRTIRMTAAGKRGRENVLLGLLSSRGGERNSGASLEGF